MGDVCSRGRSGRFSSIGGGGRRRTGRKCERQQQQQQRQRQQQLGRACVPLTSSYSATTRIRHGIKVTPRAVTTSAAQEASSSTFPTDEFSEVLEILQNSLHGSESSSGSDEQEE